MNNRDFEKQIAAILRRLDRLRAIQRGDLSVRSVEVKGHYVKRHWVGKHDRTIVVSKKRHLTSIKRAA